MKEISLLKIELRGLLASKKIYFFLGAALSQLFALATSFYILKFANAEVYGKFSYFLSVAFIIGSISTLKFEQSIVISKDKGESNQKFNLTLQTSIVISLIAVFLFQLFTGTIDFLGSVLCFILSISIALNASLQQAFLFLEKHISNGLLGAVYAFLNFLLILFLINIENGLEISYTIAYLLTGIIFYFLVIKSKFRFEFLNLKKYKNIVGENITFVKYIFPGAILTILLSYGHPILISYLYDETDLGLFSLSLRILLLPSILIGSIVGGLFRKKLSYLFLSGEYTTVYHESKKILKYLIFGAVVIYPILLFVMSRINTLLNLNGWDGIGKVSILLFIYAASQFFYIPLSNIALVCDKRKLLLNMNLIQFILTILVYTSCLVLQLSFYAFLKILSLVIGGLTIVACYNFIIIGKKLKC